MLPSSSFALSLNPNIAYLALNFAALWKKADDLAILGIRRHPVRSLRRERRRGRLDKRVKPLGHGAIRFRHLGDLAEHCALRVLAAVVRLVRFGLSVFSLIGTLSCCLGLLAEPHTATPSVAIAGRAGAPGRLENLSR